MYLLDMSENPFFIQLDEWHQKEHPYYWSKTIKLAGEWPDQSSGSKIFTEQKNNPYDFSRFISFARLKKNGELTYRVPARNPGKYKLLVIARSTQNSIVEISMGNQYFQLKLSGNNWKSFDGPDIQLSATEKDVITFKTSAEIDLDSILLIPVQ